MTNNFSIFSQRNGFEPNADQKQERDKILARISEIGEERSKYSAMVPLSVAPAKGLTFDDVKKMRDLCNEEMVLWRKLKQLYIITS